MINTPPTPLQKTVLDNLGLLLSSLSTVNDYRTDWDRVVYWQDVPTEYESNWLTYRDTFTEFSEGNRQHEQVLSVEIQAWLFGDDPATAGIEALNDLIEVLGTDQTLGGSCRFLQIKQCEKECETGGRKVCTVTLTIALTFRTGRFAAI
jgi:hypothetical protein